MFNELENFSNPKSFKKQIKISDFNKRDLIIFLKKMLLIRMVENKVAKLLKKRLLIVLLIYAQVKKQFLLVF